MKVHLFEVAYRGATGAFQKLYKKMVKDTCESPNKALMKACAEEAHGKCDCDKSCVEGISIPSAKESRPQREWA